MEFGECTAKQTQAMMWQADKVEKKITGIRLSECGGHGMSTFMSYYILCAAADTAGMTTALKMLREYYGAMLSVGATTFWEDFDLEWMRDGATIVELCEMGNMIFMVRMENIVIRDSDIPFVMDGVVDRQPSWQKKRPEYIF